MKKAIVTMVASAALSLSMMATCGASFSDVPATHWAFDEILYAAQSGIVNGTGVSKFEPEKTLTQAEFIAIMTRAFYGNELDGAPIYEYHGEWFAENYSIANRHQLFAGYGDIDMYAPITRFQMAVVTYHVLMDLGYGVDASIWKPLCSEIGDINTIATVDLPFVGLVYYYGIINGVNANHDFDRDGYVTRAMAAKVFVLTEKVVNGENAGTVGGTEIPSEDEDNDVPPVVDVPTEYPDGESGNQDAEAYGPVGTVSDFEVTLGLDTHAPVTDYWSLLSAEEQEIAGKDQFNAFVQSLKDYDLIVGEGHDGRTNPYYNYATFSSQLEDGKSSIWTRELFYGSYHTAPVVSKNGYNYCTFEVVPNVPNVVLQLAQQAVGMTDREKVEFAIDEVCRRFDYVREGSVFDWSSGTKGNCDSYASALLKLLTAMGITCIPTSGTTYDGSHGWVQVCIDGDWYVADAVVEEFYGDRGLTTIGEHESIYRYDGWNDSPRLKLVKSAMRFAGK